MKIIIILISLLIINFVSAGLDPNRVILVDSFGSNLLFRTNTPVNSTK